MDDNLPVTDDLVIPAGELSWRFDSAGGPGGQHANKAATRAELSFDLGRSGAVDDRTRQRMLSRLGSRAQAGVVVVTVDDTRSQWRNRQLARRRLAELLRDSARRVKSRRPTRPTSASRRNRVEAKRRRSATKRLRRRPEID
jgi:ribosome-associated protein